MRGDRLAGRDEDPDRVGQVELALGVVRLEPLERRPERLGAEDVDRRVAPRRSRSSSGVASRASTIRAHAVRAVADDAPVAARVGGIAREDRRGRAAPRGASPTSSPQQPGGQQRRVAREHEHVAGVAGESRRAPSGPRRPVPSGCSWIATSTPLAANWSRAAGEATTTTGSAPASRPPRSPSRPCGGRGAGGSASARPSASRVPSPPAMTTAASGVSVTSGGAQLDGWGARIRTWDRGTKTRCLTAWLRPTGAASIGASPELRSRSANRKTSATIASTAIAVIATHSAMSSTIGTQHAEPARRRRSSSPGGRRRSGSCGRRTSQKTSADRREHVTTCPPVQHMHDVRAGPRPQRSRG